MSNPGQASAALASKQSENRVFSKNDIVWAKVRGYSWWPAKIARVQMLNERDRKYSVVFIGDQTTADLPHDKVVDFVEHYAKNSLTKKKDLLESIEMAKKQLRKDDLLALDKKISGADSGKNKM